MGVFQADSISSVSGTLGALNDAITLDVSNYSGAVFRMGSGTLAATIVAEASFDDGANWIGINFLSPSSGLASNALAFTNPSGPSSQYLVNLGGITHVRVRVSAYTSGSNTSTIYASKMIPSFPAIWIKDIAAATNVYRPVVGSPNGVLATETWPTSRDVYSWSPTTFTPPATPTDVFTISGSSTKTVRILQLELSTTQTTAGTNVWFLIKRSTANTAGTSTTPSPVAHDSSDPAVTAVGRQYSANPSALGTAIGNIAIIKVASPTAALGTVFTQVIDFTLDGLSSGVVLRGTSEFFCVNFNGAALPAGLSVNARVVWIEE